MRILLLHQYYLSDQDAGGSRWNEFVRMWTEKGHQICVLTSLGHYTKPHRSTHFFEESKPSPNLHIIRCYVSSAYHANYIGRFWAYLTFCFSCLWAAGFKLENRPDLIIATSPPLHIGLIAYLLSIRWRIPFVLEIRDLWPQFAIEMNVLKNRILIRLSYVLEHFLYRNARKIIVLTPTFRANIIKRFRALGHKIEVITNGADSHFLQFYQNFDANQFRQRMNWQNKIVILYVGALNPANHLIQAVESAELMQDTNLHFVLLGEGKQKEYLKAEIEKRGLPNIEVINSVPKQEVFSYILAADAGLSVLKNTAGFKSIYSNKTFDYLLCQKPVLMAIDGISRELIETAKAGIYLEPENPQDWNQKLRIFFSDPNFSDCGLKGNLFVLKNFDRSQLASQYEAILLKI